jgi:serine/threonine-protein kinase HipA
MNAEQSNPARARVDLETVIRRLHCSRIRAGLHTFDMGIFVWISDRLHRIRCERVFKQSQEGPAWEDDSAALWLHDAALRLFPGSPFCVLNARPTAEKYRGSYETTLIQRLGDFVDSTNLVADGEKLFTLIALNSALRNGDARLKNFAIIYDDVQGESRSAPVYDIVTTTVYLPLDKMALTLDGSTRWPDAKRLRRLGETRLMLTPSRIRDILMRIGDALSKTREEIQVYRKNHPDFADIGKNMIEQWEIGMRDSLKGARPAGITVSTAKPRRCPCP